MITPSKEQSKRSAAHIFAAFQYQWDYFVLQLLATNDDTITVSLNFLMMLINRRENVSPYIK